MRIQQTVNTAVDHILTICFHRLGYTWCFDRCLATYLVTQSTRVALQVDVGKVLGVLGLVLSKKGARCWPGPTTFGVPSCSVARCTAAQ